MIHNDMNIRQSELEKNSAHMRTQDALLQEIDRHEIVSFDIFDTLLIRRVLVAEDVFDLMSVRAEREGMKLYNFREMRIRAQLDTGLKNPDIYEIYDSYQKLSGIVDAVKERLVQLEIEVECDVLLPRQSVLEAFHYSLQQGKTIYLVSDMYLPKNVLEGILNRYQIYSYRELMISCDYKRLKLEGLFENLAEKEKGKSILHIGDHQIYDGVCAKNAGIDTFLVCTPWELVQRSSWAEYLKEKPAYINDRSMAGLVISRIFNSPFALEQSAVPALEEGNELGYILFAPIVTSFMIWFLNHVKNKGYEAVLFAARDGFLIQKLYDRSIEILKWYDMPKSIYFQTSRKAAVTSDMAGEAMINTLIGIREELSPEEVLHQLFGLDRSCIKPFPEGEDWDKEIYKYVWSHQNQIFKKSENMKRNYFKYMGNLDLKIGRKYAFYDFVSSGTCQKVLNKIAPFELQGYYFGWNSEENKGEFSVDSMFECGDSFFIRYYKVMELFMTSDKPSLESFDSKGHPNFSEELRSKEEIHIVNMVQNSIMDYFTEYMKILFMPEGEMDPGWADKMLNCMVKTDLSKLGFDLYDMELTDDWKQIRRNLIEILR